MKETAASERVSGLKLNASVGWARVKHQAAECSNLVCDVIYLIVKYIQSCLVALFWYKFCDLGLSFQVC